jgi:hypothetical protein
MDAQSFKRIITTFADTPGHIDLSKGKLLCEIRDEVIEATIESRDGEIFIDEAGDRLPANKWLFHRIARLPILADRIIATFPEPSYFISPKAELLDQIDRTDDNDTPSLQPAADATLDLLNRKPTGSTSVVYLTSDAGEGKTTLISYLASQQARKFKQKETDWLLVPIALGGRPFLRFDDIVVGSLSNRLRFPLFYFDAFIELVKLGVLVPAFDGFEEMFVQSASGDALSAVGTLVRTLDSAGTVLIAARKAYFEYQDIRTQVKLFDSIGASSVVFSRASLRRWGKEEFVNYCNARSVADCEDIYAQVSGRLTADHPILTRAVLVKRLLDVTESVSSLSELIRKVGNSPNDYFIVFVRAIIEREANEKWIDTSGEAAKPLLTVDEHFELLAIIAQEMWNLSTETLKADVLDLLCDIFCESRRLPAALSFQIRERAKQHPLLVTADAGRNAFAFDHEEFRNFFLGEAIGRLCYEADTARRQELLALIRTGPLPPQAVDAAVAYIRRQKQPKAHHLATFLLTVTKLDGPSSFTHENAGALILGALNEESVPEITVDGLSFHSDALRDKALTNVKFDHCTFGPTSLENTKLNGCAFRACHFERLDFHETTKITQTEIDAQCDVVSVVPVGRDTPVFDPGVFPSLFHQIGFTVAEPEAQAEIPFESSEDQQVKLLRRMLRYLFLRSTHINENVVLRKLGPGAESFVKEVIPKLMKAGILGCEWIARDRQNRYVLTLPMENIQRALSSPNLTIDRLIAILDATPASPSSDR